MGKFEFPTGFLLRLRNRIVYFLGVSVITFIMEWAISRDILSILYTYFHAEYMYFLILFPKINIHKFFTPPKKYRTHLVEKFHKPFGLAVIGLIFVSISLVVVSVTFKLFLVYKVSLICASSGICAYFLFFQISYASKIRAEDIGLETRKALVNSMILYVPFHTETSTLILSVIFSGHTLFPFIRTEYQTVPLGSIIGVSYFLLFIEIPFYLGQNSKKKPRFKKLNEERDWVIRNLKEISDATTQLGLLKKISYQVELLRIKSEMDEIRSMPMHPYKGLLLPTGILIGALLAPIVEWLIKILAI